MAGEDFFKFNKGNEFRFSNFREIKEEDLKGVDEKTKKLFNIFAGEDKILQEVEAKSLFNVLKSAAGDNQVLEDNEIKTFAKEHIGEEVDTNILATFVNNIFGTKEKPQTQTMQVAKGYAAQKQQTFLEEAACKEIVIDIIDENLSEAYEILNSQYLGSISGWHDERKDKNDILKTSNVSKVLDYQNAGIEWMNKAKLAPPNGLTKKEYYEGNKQRIKDMILTRVLVLDTNTKFKELKNKYSEEKLAQIIGDYVEQLCSNASMEDLKDIQKQFVSYSGVEEIQALENVVDNAIKFNADKNKPVPYMERPLPKFDNSKGIVPEYWNTDEPISFEEVYKIERGTEYSQYKIEQYALAKKEMEVVANAYNKKQQFIEFAEALRKDETLNIDEKAQKVLEGFVTFYALAEDGGLTQLKELIDKSKLPISIDENGFNFGTLDDNAKNRALNSLLKLAQQSKEKEFEEFLNGKTIEDYQIALAQAHDEAIGDENGKMMAEAMKNDNLTCIQRWTGKASMIGMGMVVVGGLLCCTPLGPLVVSLGALGSTTIGALTLGVGNTLAIGGMVAKTGLGVTDYATKDVQTAEEAEQLTKDFIMDAGGFIIGMGAGKAGMKAFSKLIDQKLVAVFGQQIASGNKMQALKTVFTNPEYLKNFMTAAGAKLSADFVISYAGDLAMMGILDTQDDWQSLLKANLTGILVGMSGDIKDVSGVGRPRNFGVSDGVKGVNEASRFDQPTSPHVKKPMTEMDYGQRLLGNDVTVADPKTGATVEGTVTGLHNTNGQVEIEVNGQRYSTNDVAEVKGEVKVSSDAEIKEVGKSDFDVEYNDYKGLAGSITIKDSQGTQLGNVNYSILEQNGRKVLKFEGLESNKSGMNIGTKLIEELVLKSIELGAEGRLIAEASPATGSGANGRPISNLGFYYKLGFKADDPVIDAKIRECIESGKEIPLSLNIFTKISLTEEGINSIVKNNKSNLANSIDAETAKPINAPTKMSIDAIREFVANNPELKDNKWIQDNIETLLDVCNDANNYGAPLVNLKEKMLHPLLKQHRLEILSTFLSDPNLYNDKQLQQGFKNLLYTYDAKSSKEMVESLKWYANLKDAEMQNTRNGLTLQMLDTNNLKDSYGYCLLTNRQLSLENKKLIYEYIYKNNSFELNRNASNLRELCYKISNNDDINFLLNHFNELGSNPFFDRFFTSGQDPDDAKAKISMYEYFKSVNEDLQNDDILLYITSATKDNVNFIKENYNNPEWKDYLPDILYAVKDYNSKFAQELMNDTEFPKELIKGVLDQTYKFNVDFIRNELYKNPNVPRGEIANIAQACSVTYQDKFCVELISNKDFPINQVADLLRNTHEKTIFEFAKVLYADSNIPKEDLVGITNRMSNMNIDAKKEVYKTLLSLEGFPKEQISKILIAINDNASNKDYALKLCQEYSKMELPADKIAFLVENYGKITPKQLQKLTRIAGKNNVAKLSNSDLVIACQVADLYGKTNINEIPIEGKKEALRSLVACNEGLFDISPEMQKMFPMIPTDRDAYCSLLPSIVRSLGIETNTLTSAQTTRFNQSLTDLSGSLAKISDADFADLRITQEYSKDDFIRNVLKIVKDLPAKERQKVYDYFGFELHHNKGNQTGFSITGYPVNLNNGKKLAQITDPRTKEIVELLRPEVIKFSEGNPIRCNNPQIEQLLNDVVDVLPELRAQIGKSQHGNNGTKGSHNFDVLQHSLKVMQKISQDPKFKELNESDQKVMMLASLLHDITKREGSIDKTHANESAFDTFFIAKKFNLSREEEIKLYALAKHHEWLEYVNTSKSEEQLTKRLQSVAYDLQNDNLFDMALMFTHADLRAVKVDDTFHDTTVGRGRKAFDGTVRSYGESADVYAKRIQNYIQELQKSQPLLPVTKIPAASRIAEAITVVRPDGSTNIKGVYKDKDGLIIIKYNEVEDWEAIGFPKGSISRGIEAQKGINYGDEKLSENVNTGNIKFFAHGLDYENQLAKFDAFGLVDSDVLLSISYAERPESKYRFFRAQGVLLDFDTKYVHGGGNTDSGSGCGKTIADFKKDYIFGGERETDRLYVSDLIKKATGMSDSEYIEFIKANENKPLSEIEPVELRETIVRAFASINSNTRKGAREYNEMYGSNPKEVMAVFAYSVDYTENLGNPVDFLNRTKVNPNERHSFGKALPKSVSERTEFLRRYALEHNVPFVVFGD